MLSSPPQRVPRVPGRPVLHHDARAPEESLRRARAAGRRPAGDLAKLDRELAGESPAAAPGHAARDRVPAGRDDAELAWVNGVTDDLRAGSLTWAYEDFEAIIVADEALRAAVHGPAV